MKKIFIFSMLFVIVKIQAQSYQISFAGTGASSTIDSVKVENLTQCKTVFLNSGDILNLSSNAGIDQISNISDNTLHISPNPTTGNCIIGFEAISQGDATICLYDIAGKRISQVTELLMKGNHKYSISGIGNGIYMLKVESNQYSYTAKIVSYNSISGIAEIRHESQVSSIKTQDNANKSLKSNKSLKGMNYNTGDILKLKGISGIYCTVFMLVPTQSQTVTFDFIPCTDYVGNHYAVVKIGTQVWMEDNLKTTTLNNTTLIQNVTDGNTWKNSTLPAYCWYNDSIKYKNIYGALYNWYAINTGKLCPTGWVMPDSTAWATLINNTGGTTNAGGAMKQTCSDFWTSPNTGATNSSGFTALPGGLRSYFNGKFYYIGNAAFWWSSTAGTSTQALHPYLEYSSASAILLDNSKADGFSVRCIKSN
jgi:uncharacterized protein (TIGR02145 family)